MKKILVLIISINYSILCSAQYQSFFGESVSEWNAVVHEPGIGWDAYYNVNITCTSDTIIDSTKWKICTPYSFSAYIDTFNTKFSDAFYLSEDTATGILVSRIKNNISDTFQIDTVCNLGLLDSSCIEGIGGISLFHILAEHVPLGVGGYGIVDGRIICYLKDGIIVYSDTAADEFLPYMYRMNGQLNNCIWYTNVESEIELNSIDIWPNPSSNKIHMKFNGDRVVNKIYVYNSTGQLNRTIDRTEDDLVINFDDGGIYNIVFVGDHVIFSRKIFITGGQ